MNFDKTRPKPSDRSILRKNIGRAPLHKNMEPYLKIWDIDFIPRVNKDKYDSLRDIEKEKSIGKMITKILRSRFYFSS